MNEKFKRNLVGKAVFFSLAVASLYFSEGRWGRVSTNIGLFLFFIFVFFGEAIHDWLKSKK